MFKNDLREASSCVFPVLLKVQPTNVSKMHEDFDIDEVKGQLMEIFMNDIGN